jgi:hypothetical protein
MAILTSHGLNQKTPVESEEETEKRPFRPLMTNKIRTRKFEGEKKGLDKRAEGRRMITTHELEDEEARMEREERERRARKAERQKKKR